MKSKKETKAVKAAKALETIRRKGSARHATSLGRAVDVSVDESSNPSNGWRAPEADTSAPVPETSTPAAAETAKVDTREPKHCPECGAEIPRRYRICDGCLAKHQAARRKRAVAAPATAQDATAVAPSAAAAN